MSSFTLTKLRADVLEILHKSKTPLKAYDILEQLRKVRPNAQPPTVYRVLDFLKSKDIIHEITHQHRYISCQSAAEHGEHPINLLLICSECEQVSEQSTHKLAHSLRPIAKQHHFVPTSSTVELEGVCQQCQ